MVQAHHRQPVVVFGVQREVADDGDAHADGHVALDHLRVVHLQHHVVVDAALPELLLHPTAAQALGTVQNERERGHILDGHGVPLQ